jgi:putative DNA methylase
VSDGPRRKLIEVALPLEAINVASAREKSIRHGHPSTLHLWWSRKPLATCRAVLFASLVDDPSSDPDRFPTPKAVEEERTRLFGIIERLVQWDSTTNLAILDEARAEIRRSTGTTPPVLDPFCGGGSIPLEAQRLGLTAYASDLNPVAVLITKALIEIPPKFANRPPVHPNTRGSIEGAAAWPAALGLAEDVRHYGEWMRGEAERRIGHAYPSARLPAEYGGAEVPAIAWIWARTVPCPNPACQAEMILSSKFVLSSRKRASWWAEPRVDPKTRRVTFRMRSGEAVAAEPTVGRQGAICLVCRSATPLSHVRSEAQAGRMGARLLAVVAEGPSGKVFLTPDERHESAASLAQAAWGPEELVTTPSHDVDRLPMYGMRRWRDAFSSRQLLALTTFSDLVLEARQRVVLDAVASGLADDGQGIAKGGAGAAAYADAVATYLALAVDRSADYWSTIATWVASGDFVAHTFGRQAIPMSWDFAEAAPLANASGSWLGAIDWIARALDTVPAKPFGFVAQADARKTLQISSDAVVSTDPPYYDNIMYADIADFFYVWLRRSAATIYPELFDTLLSPKEDELAASPHRHGGDRGAAQQAFERGLEEAFQKIGRASNPSYPISIYYGFKQAEADVADDGGSGLASTGWETMLEALIRAGLSINGTWPMRSERPTGLKKAVNALASSILLVCRPIANRGSITTRRAFVASLKTELPDAIRTLQHGNIAPVDLAQASIGPGMAIFTRYAKVLEPDGSEMRVRTALTLINGALDELLTELEGEFDADTRWAIAWYEQFGLTEAAYGTAETLSKAKNSSVAGLVEAGIIAASRGRVRLLERAEYSGNWDPTKDNRIPVWEATQRLVHLLLTDGEAAAGDLLARLGGLGDTARDLAYRMYHVAERKGWTDEARAYNALVVAWTDLARGADLARAAQPAQTSLGLE